MKSSNCINLALKNIKSHKKQTISTVITTAIAFLIIMISISLPKMLSKYHETMVNKNPLFRTYSITFNEQKYNENEVVTILKNIENVTQVFYNSEFNTIIEIEAFKTAKLNGVISIYGSNSTTLPKITKGRTFLDDEVGVAICPNLLLPHSAESFFSITKKDYIDGDKLLEENINFTYNELFYTNINMTPEIVQTHNYSFKVVGLYDNNVTPTYDNVCFVNYKDVKLLKKAEDGNIKDLSELQKDTLMLTVDDVKNNPKVINYLNKLNNQEFGIYAMPMAEIATDFMPNLIIKTYVIMLITIIIYIIISLLMLLKKIKNRQSEIGLLKSYGYKNKDISNIILIEQFIIIIGSFIIFCVVFGFICLIGNYLFNNVYLLLSNLKIEFAFLQIIIILAIFLLLHYLLSNLILTKITKLSPIVSIRN